MRFAALSASAIRRLAKPTDNSTNAGSFISVSACSGVFERMRRVHAASPAGASNIFSAGCGVFRQRYVYAARRKRSSPLLAFHVLRCWPRSMQPSGCGGNTPGPPIFALSKPLEASAKSRTTSASRRNRACLPSHLLYGSTRSKSARRSDTCRYVAEVTISR